MSAISNALLPPVPLTLEGASVLHQMMRVRWAAWKALPAAAQNELIAEATTALSAMEAEKSALFSLIGHKGDLLLVHFRSSFDDLNRAELQLARLGISDYLETTSSYLSVVELGLYESTSKVYS